MMCIKDAPFKNQKLTEHFQGRTYRFFKAHGTKDNHFKNRLCEMFLNEYEKKVAEIKIETKLAQRQQYEERDEESVLQIEENFTFLGIKNRQNRFVKVRPNEFADIVTLE